MLNVVTGVLLGDELAGSVQDVWLFCCGWLFCRGWCWMVGWLVGMSDKQLPPEAELVTLPVAVATAQAGVRQVLVFCWVRLNPSCPLAW